MGAAVRCGRALALCLLVASLGCGSGGGVPPAAVTLLATLKALLLGSREVAVIDAQARAAIVLELMSDGEIRFAATAQAGWVGDITMMHIHRGAAAVNGVPVVDLLSAGATFDPATFTAAGSVPSTAALATEIANAPGDFYVNIHTNAAPLGLVREQLGAFAPLEWHATLLPGNEVNPVVSPATGAATLRVSAPDTIDYVLAVAGRPIADITMGHIHIGAAGVNGTILVDLQTAAAALDGVVGTLTGGASLSLAALARICANLGGFYVNLHTATEPLGFMRGQLGSGPVEFWAALDGDEEAVPQPGNTGGFTLEVDTFASGFAIFAVPVAQGIDDVTMAHVHVGAKGVNGPPLIDLMTGADFSRSTGTGSADGTVVCTQALLARMMADPAGFYANLHSAAAPLGLVRGQLTRNAVTFFAGLSGADVVPPGSGANTGALTCLLTGSHEFTFTLTMQTPPVGLVDGCGLFNAGPGANGPQLVDLFLGTDLVTSGPSVSGVADFAGRTAARMLAGQEFYAAATVSGGEVVRGEALLVTEDLPPAGLLYSSPTPTYKTGQTITANVPSSVGGAITNYGVAPPLPPGLVLNPVTGIITGTPTALQAAKDHVVTASNASGSADATVRITVEEGPPLTLNYNTPVTYTVGTQIPPNVPVATGGTITNYASNKTLPSGLSLHATTGVISGTPNAAAVTDDYIITGSNGAGSVQKTVRITVNAVLQPPSNLSYSHNPVTYTTGTAITNNVPTVTGSVTSWSITGTLPAGLSFNTGDGVLSGTPTAPKAKATYTVTASNAAGGTQVGLEITVVEGPPVIDAYSYNPNIGYVGQGSLPGVFYTMVPTTSGGSITSWSIDKQLPAGIGISSTTGYISGTPTATSSETTYRVTATGPGGSGTFDIKITIQ